MRTDAGGSFNRQLLSRDLKTGNNCGENAHGAATHECTTPSKSVEESLTPSCSRPTTLEAFLSGELNPDCRSEAGRRVRPPTEEARFGGDRLTVDISVENHDPRRRRLMAPARAALRLRPSPLSAQSPPTYRLHDVITNPSVLPKSPILNAVIDPRPGRHYLYNETGSTAATRWNECGRSGEQRNSSSGDVCTRLCVPADVSVSGPGGHGGMGPAFASVLRQVYCKQRENAVTGGCGDPGAWRARMRGGMRLGWGRVKKWKG